MPPSLGNPAFCENLFLIIIKKTDYLFFLHVVSLQPYREVWVSVTVAQSCEWICCRGDRGYVQPSLCGSKQLDEGAKIQTQTVGTQ